jgi:hypothetical protein
VVDAPDRAEPYVVCEARDQWGTTLTCLGTEPGYVDAVLGMRDYGHVVFTVAADGACTFLAVGTFAKHLPFSAP